MFWGRQCDDLTFILHYLLIQKVNTTDLLFIFRDLKQKICEAAEYSFWLQSSHSLVTILNVLET